MAPSHGPQKTALKFSQKLLGKQQSTDALQKKLKALHTELAAFDQDLIDVESLSGPHKELINRTILLHKDRGVKAYAACCLADIIRLSAPNAPYSEAELQDIFGFFFIQLKQGLTGTDASYYSQYFHLLESLSTVKSVVLICDLPTADDLIEAIFTTSFTLVKRSLPRKIEMFIADILSAVLDECHSLRPTVTEQIMNQFKAKKLDTPGHRLAVLVCNNTADRLQRHVSSYFTDIIVAHDSEEGFEAIEAAHETIKQLNIHCPSLLHSVIPQLEEELRAEDVELRSIATGVLGDMFSAKGGPDLVKKYPSTWNTWLGRKNDKAPAIRLKFVESTKGLLLNLPELRDVVDATLIAKMMDPDDKVRAMVCKAYGQLDYESALHHVSLAQLQQLAGRVLDRKASVRHEAMKSLGKLYALAYPEIENNEPAAISQFGWIPTEVFHMHGKGAEVKPVIEKIVADYILPLPSIASSLSSSKNSKSPEVDEAGWTDRLLNTMKGLDEQAITSLLNLSNLKSNKPTLWDVYLESCIKNNGGVIDENEEAVTNRLKAVVQRLSAGFPDPQKVSEDLHTFANNNDKRLYQLFKTCMDSQTDIKALIKSLGEFTKRLETSFPTITGTFLIALRRACPRIINQSSVPTLIKRVQKETEHATNAGTILNYVSKHCPSLYKPHVSELTKAIADVKNPQLVSLALQAMAALVQGDGKLSPSDKKTKERIRRIVMEPSIRQAKFAARILAFSLEKENVCTEIVEAISDGLEDANAELLAAHVGVLVQITRFVPDAFEHRSDVIMTFLLKQILMIPCPPSADDMDTEEEWAENHQVTDILKARVMALKVCRHRSLAHATSETAMDISTPVFKMLFSLLDYSGSFQAESSDDRKVQSRMRLQAAVSLLHLSTIPEYAKIISQRFVVLGLTVQDSCYQVRHTFLTKVLTLLTPKRLPPQFNLIPFLTVHDPESLIKDTATAYTRFVVNSLPPASRVAHLEIIFIRFLHLLAHHPDFGPAHGELTDTAKYVNFYLDQIANADTVSLLYHLAMKAKTVRDVDPEYNDNLYMMSELAQELIKARAQSHSWTLQTYPGKLKLPSDILKPMPNAEAGSKVLKKVYLPEETRMWIAEGAKPAKQERGPRKTAKRKAPAPKMNGSAKRPKPRQNKWDSDDDEEEPSATEPSDDEDVEPAPPSSKPAEEEDVPQGRAARATRRQSRNSGT